ncbi:MAG: hypothetical protein ACRC8Y_17215 [Chroococcales cyanobacterium]
MTDSPGDRPFVNSVSPLPLPTPSTSGLLVISRAINPPRPQDLHRRSPPGSI